MPTSAALASQSLSGQVAVVAGPRRLLRPLVGEVGAAHAGDLWGAREVDRGGGALLRGLHERPHQREHQPHPPTAVLMAEGRAHHAGVQHGRGHAGAFEPTRQLVGEQHVGELGLVVGALAVVGPLALQVVEVDPAHRLRPGRHGDHAGGSAGNQQVLELVGEEERGEVVEREGVLEAVHGDVPVRPVAADVVDEHVEARVGRLDLGGQAPYLGLGGHVRLEHVHLGRRHLPSYGVRGGRARAAERPTIPTRAPRPARPVAVASPIPPVPPVTSAVEPRMLMELPSDVGADRSVCLVSTVADRSVCHQGQQPLCPR